MSSRRSLLAALVCAACFLLLALAAPAHAARNLRQLSSRQAAMQNVAQGAIYRATHGAGSIRQANSAIGATTASVANPDVPLHYVATGEAGAYFAGGGDE